MNTWAADREGRGKGVVGAIAPTHFSYGVVSPKPLPPSLTFLWPVPKPSPYQPPAPFSNVLCGPWNTMFFISVSFTVKLPLFAVAFVREMNQSEVHQLSAERSRRAGGVAYNKRGIDFQCS